MIARVLAMAATYWREALRQPSTWVVAALLALLLPGIALALGGDAAVWLARSGTAEFTRLVLPVAAIAGAGFLLRPGAKRGWALLSARRGEWFAATALAAAGMLAAAGLLFGAGAWAALALSSPPLERTTQATGMQIERERNGERMVAPGREQGLTWANPATNDALIMDLPQGLPEKLRGRLEYRIAWTGTGAPGTQSPVALSLYHGGRMLPVRMEAESQTRVHFEAEGVPPGAQLVVHAVEPVFVVGTAPDLLRLQTGTGITGMSVLALLVLGLGGTLLCVSVVLAFRAYTTAPTAVLAGLLLMASLTLLPGLVPSDAMARHRRASMEATAAQTEGLAAADLLEYVPRLFPEEPFQELSAGRVVPARAVADGLLRALAGVILLVPGAWLFSRRNIT